MAYVTLVDDDGNNIGVDISRSLERIADALEEILIEPEGDPAPVLPLDLPRIVQEP